MTVHLVFSLHDFLVASAIVLSSAALVAWLHDHR
jgi:hypothetical protein